jgi:hypothetical protein
LTLKEKDFQEAFQKWRRWWNRCLHARGNYFKGDGGLTVSFTIFTASFWKIFDTTSYNHKLHAKKKKNSNTLIMAKKNVIGMTIISEGLYSQILFSVYL